MLTLDPIQTDLHIPLMHYASQGGVSDLFLRGGERIRYRINNGAIVVSDDVISDDSITRFCAEFGNKKDFSWDCSDDGFLLRCCHTRQVNQLNVRVIRQELPDYEMLNLPPKVDEIVFGKKRGGLVIISGETGSGKSTTLATILSERSKRFSEHILSIENPIEYKFQWQTRDSLITQLEYDEEEECIQHLQSALRMNPDVLVVGEIRKYKEAELLLRASEAGILVLTTIHSKGSANSLEKIVSLTEGNDKLYCMQMLQHNCKCVIHQKLPSFGGVRVPVQQILFNTLDKDYQPVRSLLYQGNFTGLKVESEKGYHHQETDSIRIAKTKRKFDLRILNAISQKISETAG
jgi:Tfp pilus assembly pilus retraction ATPase PilT